MALRTACTIDILDQLGGSVGAEAFYFRVWPSDFPTRPFMDMSSELGWMMTTTSNVERGRKEREKNVVNVAQHPVHYSLFTLQMSRAAGREGTQSLRNYCRSLDAVDHGAYQNTTIVRYAYREALGAAT